ncbi:MAG: hypothetical protein WAT92_23160 [Saprospiraceae bacterium]
MNTFRKLKEEKKNFEPFLEKSDYIFIGPNDINLLEDFMKIANQNTPVVRHSRKIKDFLTNDEGVEVAIASLPNDAQLRIYIVVHDKGNLFIHSTVEDYCKERHIKR